MSVFVDTSIWFSAMVAKDRDNLRAKNILRRNGPHVTTDHVVIETWLLLKSRHSMEAGLQFWQRVRTGAVLIEFALAQDLEKAWWISRTFPDQAFSVVDCTSFAIMERLGIARAASFDHHFAVYRYGPNRDLAFDVLR